MLEIICRITINMTVTNANKRQRCLFRISNSMMALQLVAWIFQNAEFLIKFHTKQLQLRN